MNLFGKKSAEIAVEGMEAADKLFSSKDEMAAHYTQRHANDMESDSWLSKNVRPMYLIGTFFLVTIMLLAIVFGRTVDMVVFTAIIGMASSASGWYFSERSSRKNQQDLIRMYSKNMKDDNNK